MQRLTDPNNLYSRFVYWSLAVKMFVAHPILGVGHMQFGKVYLDYVQDLSNVAHFDIGKVSVADNMYLTTTVEHGALGLATLIGVFVAAALLLKSFRTRLLALGRGGRDSSVRSAGSCYLRRDRLLCRPGPVYQSDEIHVHFGWTRAWRRCSVCRHRADARRAMRCGRLGETPS